jgi:hypothetical protein
MAEKRVIELEVKDNVPNLKQQYKEAVKEVQKLVQVYGETSQQVAEAAKRAADLKDQIEDTNDAIAAFKGEGTYVAVGKAISSVASGFSAVEGAMGLVGVESEALQETMLRVQSAMALAQGLEGLEDAGRAFKQVGAIAMDALKGIRTGLLLTGIGAFVVILGTVAAYWDDIKKAVGGVNEKQAALNSTMDAYREGAKQAIQETTEVANSFELARQGVISKEEALFKYNETLGDSFGKAKNLNEAEALYAKKTDAYIKATSLRAQAQALFAKAADEQVKALTASLEDQRSFAEKSVNIFESGVAAFVDYSTAGLTNLSEKADKKTEQTFQNAQKRVKKESETRSKQINDLAADLLKEAELVENKNGIISENEKKTQDDIAAKRKEAAEKRKADLKTIKDAEKEYNRSILSDKEQEILAEQDKFNELIKLAQKHGYDTTNLRLALKNSLNDIEAKYAQQELDLADQINKAKRDKEIEERNRKEAEYRERIAAEEAFYDEYNAALLTQQQAEVQAVTDKYFNLIEEAKKYGLSTVELEEKMNKEVADINKKYSEATKAQKIQAVQDTLSTIGNLAIVFAGQSEEQQKKAFQIQKAANIANATIDTYKAATGAYASLSSIPTIGPILGAAAAAAAIAAGLANVKAIASQKFEGGGASAGGGGNVTAPSGAGGSVITPNFNIVGNAQATNPLAGLGTQPLQAYVVSGEVTTAQNLDRNRINYATFG